ncbi:MAG: GTP-binding protein, partial [Candidatus Pacebacteria bacterium]|nr:GTP-binding protein [Candidatus Paceibacterota bacterium]
MKNNNVQVAESNLIPRPPIVVVLGHVDHGKTTLLDYIRHTKVADKETGAITQHIGAYEITVNPSGNNPQETRPRNITFLDTPGHEAFSKIRSRGAKAADIAILVVAADEGVKPQTQEAFQHIQSAGLPFIVAINKIDKPTANPDKVKRELTEIGIYLEGWGGDVPFCEISAKTGQGINELLELILLLADLNELKADPLAPASGLVIDAYLDSKRGYTATLLITNGTLQLNDKIVAGQVLGKIKIL